MFAIDHPTLRTAHLLPHPWLQTLAGTWPWRGRGLARTSRWLAPTRDGDSLVLHDDRGPEWITGDRIVLLVHGLCGSHASPYVARAASRLVRAGFRSIRVDMRGCGEARFRSRGHFHAGASDDLADAVAAIRQLSPLSPVTLVGFSLGGNAALRLAGTIGDEPAGNLDSVIAVAPPVDLVWCSGNLRQWGNRAIDWYFTARLRHALARRRRRVRGLKDNGLVHLPRRLVHFDDRFVAPVCGFQGARDYYRQCSAAPLLERIGLATLIVAAQDDPVVPAGMFRRWPVSRRVELVTTRGGGHLGFIGTGRGDPDRHWLDWRLVAWIRSLDS